MSTTRIKLSKEAKEIVLDYKDRIGNRPALVSEDLRKAVLAACVLSKLIQSAAYAPDQTVKGYADLYFESRAALLLDDADTGTVRLVAEKFGL